MINVLYICTDWHKAEGSSLSLLNLINATRSEVNPIVLLSHQGEVEEMFHNNNIETIVSPFFYLWEKPKKIITAIHHPTRTRLFRRLFLNRQCCYQVLRKIHNRPIDIVHTNTSITDIGVSLAKYLRAKHVWHIRENLTALNINPYGGFIRLKRLINAADARIVISQAILTHWNFPKGNTFLLHDAVLPALPMPHPIQRQPQILFCAAEISDFKGAPIAVEAFCRANLKDYKLVLAGNCSDTYRQKLLFIADRYGLSSNLIFIGYQSNMVPHYLSASAFLMCSQFEGLGRVTLEAMAYGCPVIAYADGGTTDFITHGETGWLFSTVDECAQLLHKVITADCKAITKSARELVGIEYTEKNYGDRIINLYHSLIS